jgi:hypothetical protein
MPLTNPSRTSCHCACQRCTSPVFVDSYRGTSRKRHRPRRMDGRSCQSALGRFSAFWSGDPIASALPASLAGGLFLQFFSGAMQRNYPPQELDRGDGSPLPTSLVQILRRRSRCWTWFVLMPCVRVTRAPMLHCASVFPPLAAPRSP